jgi:hypothetical protein
MSSMVTVMNSLILFTAGLFRPVYGPLLEQGATASNLASPCPARSCRADA